MLKSLQVDFSRSFPHHEVEVICGDFEHKGEYDVIVEQTFFCALNVNLRSKYVNKMHDLLSENGKIIGVLFNKDFGNPFPPFGGNEDEYRNLFQDKFEIKATQACYNSIKPRENTEVFINFKKEIKPRIMKKNMGNTDKYIRLFLAILFSVLVYFKVAEGYFAITLLCLAMVFILTSLTGFYYATL